MEVDWKHHFKYYDLFQMNRSDYVKSINFHLKKLKGFSKILDSGAGSGNLTFELLKAGHEVVAIDSNKYALDILKIKCEKYKKNLSIFEFDVQDIGLRENSFDAISSMFVVPFVKNNERYFSEVYRLLKNKGLFSISAWAPEKDVHYGIMELQKKELEKKGILPKYEKEWEYAMESAADAGKQVLNGDNFDELKSLLSKIGFKKIKMFRNNPYGKYAYFITCMK